jgi:Ca2+-binding RTX toxin-like protein
MITMPKLKTATLAGLVLLCTLSTAAAQDASCPASNRLQFVPFGQPPINLLDGARYDVVFGLGPNRDGTPVMRAIVHRNGSCIQGFMFVGRNGLAETRLNANSNICLGGNNDVVRVVNANTDVFCNGSAQELWPLNYNGFRLSIYGGGGNDNLAGGAGPDSIYGGAGGDALGGVSGSNDQLFGESGADIIAGSSGSLTRNAGADGADVIVDRAGISDTIDGGANNDRLESGCNNTPITCGSGTDTAFSPNPRPFGSLCESWNQQSC